MTHNCISVLNQVALIVLMTTFWPLAQESKTVIGLYSMYFRAPVLLTPFKARQVHLLNTKEVTE